MRGLAAQLGTSPATVNSAYRILRSRGLAIGEGRRGTRVAPRPPLQLAHGPDGADAPAGRRDLTHGLPDPALLPPLAPALARTGLTSGRLSLEPETADPDLIALGRATFAADGIPADALTVVGGALDGVDRALEARLSPGDSVLIEDPAYPPLRDVLLARRLHEVPVPVDDRGLIPDALERALANRPEALVVVPRAQNPFGAALDSERAAELRAVLGRRPGLLVLEDDHAALVAGPPYVTLVDGRERWAVIRSASKILHPDLRLALMAADPETLARVAGRYALGPRWVSHLLQRLTAELMGDPDFADGAVRARRTYAARRSALIDALADRGLDAHGGSGMNVWIPVAEEAPVVAAAADAGWLILAGERFRLRTPPAVRVTTARLPVEEADELAGVLARAARGDRVRPRY